MAGETIRQLATILYLDMIPGERIQEMTLAGIRRYAAAQGWNVAAVPVAESRPDGISAHLAAHRPVAGCIVECADGRRDLPPRLFGNIPVVYLHATPSFYGGHGMRVNSDNEAIAAAAFRELSAGHPAAFAVVSFIGLTGRRSWSLARERAFTALAATSGKPFFSLPWKKETRKRRAARLAAWLAALPRHTAVFAVNDITAANVVEAASLCHRSIPRDLTLLGVDNNTDICEASRPTISSIQIDHERAGYVAARLLAATMKSRAPRGMKSAACAANDGNAFAPETHSSFGGGATIGPLMAVRRESTRGSGRREPFVLEAVETIRREAYDSEFTAAGLAARFRCSPRLFRLRFRESMGHSVADEIQHVRLEKVFTLLSRTDTAIGAIAGLCGYRSDIALKWIFRKITGMSMREWRTRNRH